MRPLLSDEQYEKMRRLSEEFELGIGPKLQRYLLLKSWFSANYITDWWEEYVYLRSRSPLMVNSNYYGLDVLQVRPTHLQSARAANMITALLEFRRLIDREALKPLMIMGVPLCSYQYERMFNTCRIPGVETDHLRHWDVSNHIAVLHKGCWWKFPVHNGRRLLSPAELEDSLMKIQQAEEKPQPGERQLAAMTAGHRVPWATARKQHFRKGVNKVALDTIERSAFVLVLDDSAPDYDPNDSEKLDNFAHVLLHGKGDDRWFDKSFNLIICSNGRCGVNAEHSWADAPLMSHLCEHALLTDVLQQQNGYDADGHAMGEVAIQPPPPTRLKWDIPEEVYPVIESQYAVAKALYEDVEMRLMLFQTYGKGFIKTCKVSPDAYIQMALQLTNYRDQGKFCLTYEASMTRLFREGRTETVRTVSEESCAFVLGMENPAVTDDEKAKLLRNACNVHQSKYLDAMCGKGVDRHMFGLYVVSRYLELDSPFLKEALHEPWRLSTSQTPTQQTELLDLNKHPECVTAGGGFGPVADDGYGVSYIVGGDHSIAFHVSSKKSCPTTSSARFRETLRRTLMDMHNLFDAKNKKPTHPEGSSV